LPSKSSPSKEEIFYYGRLTLPHFPFSSGNNEIARVCHYKVMTIQSWNSPAFHKRDLISGMTNFLFLDSFRFSKVVHTIPNI